MPLAAKLDNVRNILYMDTSEGREAHARRYQRSDLCFKTASNLETSLVRPQLFACNHIPLHNLA